MALEIYGNNDQTTIASGISPTAVSVTLLSGTGATFPNPAAGQFFRMTFNDVLTGLEFEIVYVTSRGGDVCTILRGQENTTALAWASGDRVFCGPTGGAMANLTQQQQVQQNTLNYAVDTGSANAYAITLNPTSLSTPVPGALIYFLAANPNTTFSTVVVNGGSTYPLLGKARSALQGGEVVAFSCMTFDAALASYVLLYSSGGATQTAAATASNQAITLGQANTNYAQLAGLSTQAFAASQLNTPVVASPTSGAATLTLEANGGVKVTNVGGSALETVTAANGAVNSASTQVVTGQQLQNVYKVGEVKLWHGIIANIAAVWGPGWQLADGTNGTGDYRGKVPIGAGTTFTLNQTGGSSTAALSLANMASHNHPIFISDPTHAHLSAGAAGIGQGSPGPNAVQQSAGGTQTTFSGTGITASSGAVGSGTPFSILPPFYALYFIEYTGIGA
jgi:microcystin-dependent protein